MPDAPPPLGPASPAPAPTWVRLLVHNSAAAPPAGAALVTPGEHRTYVRLRDNPEIDTAEAQRLLAR